MTSQATAAFVPNSNTNSLPSFTFAQLMAAPELQEYWGWEGMGWDVEVVAGALHCQIECFAFPLVFDVCPDGSLVIRYGPDHITPISFPITAFANAVYQMQGILENEELDAAYHFNGI